MSISTVIKSGLSILLDNPIIVEGAQKKALSIINSHFTFSSDEIFQAYEDSYSYSITAISAGLAAPDKKLLAFVQKVIYSKVTREFAEPIEKNYFLAFAKNRGVPTNDLSALRQQLIDELQNIANVSFFKLESDADLSALINYQASDNLTELILDKISPLDDTLAEFLRYEDFLGKAILFFFRELMRKYDRLYKTQAALQRENLCLDVQNFEEIVKSAQANMSKAMLAHSENFLEIAQQVQSLHQIQASWESRSAFMLDFPVWRDFCTDKLNEIDSGVKGNSSKLDKVMDMLATIMQQQNLSSQLKPSDEFTQHNSQNLKLIKLAVSEFKHLSQKDKKYSQVSMMLGSALSSFGELKKAERLFYEVLEKSSVKADRAVAHFNLFQVNQQSRSGLSFFGNAVLGGTLDYSPPEQQSYERYLEPSAKNDVFAFGMTFYRLFTNERPRPFLSDALPQNVEALCDLLCDCVAPNPNERPDSAEVLVKKLEEILSTEKPDSYESNYTADLNGVTLDMVSIPGGTFIMGSPETEKDRFDHESPQHQVTISPFYMGKYQVTQAQWQAVMGNNPSDFKGDNRPVEYVSWNDAVKFCKKVSKLTGETYRLATEAEWEYACRAGTTTRYSFGDDESSLGDYAWYGEDWNFGSTHPVGEKKPNAFGLYDMHGNVWEWCCSEYHSEYQGDENKCNNNAILFVLRGGSWNFNAWWTRSASRFRFVPTVRFRYFGFRLIRTP